MNKLGMHVHGMRPGIIQAVELLQPRTITMMDPTAQELRDIYSVADPISVVRKYEDGRSFTQTDPRWWAEEYYRMVGSAVSDRLVALGMNEPFGHDRRDLVRPFDEWTRDFILRCRELGPMDGGALAMATGNWTGADNRYRITDDFPDTCEIAKYFLPHEYCWPTLEIGVPWYVLRYRAWIKDLEAAGKEGFFVITSEAGLTQAIIADRPDHGWRSGGPEGVTEDSYISTIDWYNARLCEDWRVLGCCLYDWAGSHYGWESFEQLGLENRIYQIQAPELPEPPEPPNGGDRMIRVLDIDNVELYDEAAANLIAYHGITVHEPANMRQDEWYWAVVLMDEREGPAATIYTGLLADGSPAVGQEAAWAWADDMGDADDIKGDNYPTDHQKEADIGYLNENGNMGPAFGQSGWYHDPYEPGPGRAWIRDPLRWSVLLTGIGMLGATNHRTMYPTWQLKQWEGDNGEPPEDPIDRDLLAAVLRLDENVAKMLEIMEKSYTPPDEPPVEDTPFRGEYFDNIALSGEPVLVREDGPFPSGKAIDFVWGDGSPGPGIGVDNFSVRWTGKRTFEDRRYTFHVLADDGVRLYIGNQLVIDQWHDQSETPYEVRLPLTAKEWDIRLDYYERGGRSVCKFWWEAA